MFTTLVHSQSAGQILAYKTFYFLSPHGQSVSRELKNAMTGESIAKKEGGISESAAGNNSGLEAFSYPYALSPILTYIQI
jgi:hypothetical protein